MEKYIIEKVLTKQPFIYIINKAMKNFILRGVNYLCQKEHFNLIIEEEVKKWDSSLECKLILLKEEEKRAAKF